jgi:hypothetical protein
MKRFTPEQERILNEWARTAPELRRAFPYTTASDVATKGLGFLLNKELDLGRFYISVQQSDGKQLLDVTETLSFNADSFYLSRTSDPFEIMVNFRGTAGTGSSTPGISSITFKDGSGPSISSDTLTFNNDSFYLSKDSSGKALVNLSSIFPPIAKHFTLQAPTKRDTITWFVAERNFTVNSVSAFLRTLDSGFYPFADFTIRHRAGIPARGKGTELTTGGWRVGFYIGGKVVGNPITKDSFNSNTISNNDFVWLETTNLGEADGKEQELHVTMKLV